MSCNSDATYKCSTSSRTPSRFASASPNTKVRSEWFCIDGVSVSRHSRSASSASFESGSTSRSRSSVPTRGGRSPSAMRRRPAVYCTVVRRIGARKRTRSALVRLPDVAVAHSREPISMAYSAVRSVSGERTPGQRLRSPSQSPCSWVARYWETGEAARPGEAGCALGSFSSWSPGLRSEIRV